MGENNERQGAAGTGGDVGGEGGRNWKGVPGKTTGKKEFATKKKKKRQQESIERGGKRVGDGQVQKNPKEKEVGKKTVSDAGEVFPGKRGKKGKRGRNREEKKIWK